ncbi:butyrate kinase [Desulfovibrio ferrophilus]|uniref:Probable butyrate kinase n=1 Tax=Desulfovibrio ferrophilus TaxID=241368 RepID=A0A2Z6B124_9BACT|nr:butyrate kinase [Desulfovibrio ferrophilus]BBD09202.1 probable butyrate kinase [Desulfovibrio ferrophilus]
MTRTILTINPGSTSTKVVIFKGDKVVYDKELMHPRQELASLSSVAAQFPLRSHALTEALSEALAKAGKDGRNFDAVVGRGGLLAPLPGGTYSINHRMLDDLREARYGEHACNLGAPMALEIGQTWDIPAYVVDPPVTDEMVDKARLTGLPQVRRRSIFHALSQRGAARTAAARHGVDYAQGRFIVAHMGGGISIGAHREGQVVDVINALDGEGPMSPERCGSLPALEVLNLLDSGTYDSATLRHTILREGGLFAHLGTNDFREVTARMEGGDAKAQAVFQALSYGIAKHAASLMPALNGGKLTAVVLAGGMARSQMLTDELTRLLDWAGPVEIVTGLEEMQVMAQGALRVLEGQEAIKEYKG